MKPLPGISLAYNVSIPGYPQAAPLLSTAYENQDYNGDGQTDGRVYLYFTYNAKPGGIYMLSDEPGQTSGTAVELSVRQVTSRNTVSVPSVQTGKAPFITKNDSNYLMALETNGAYLNSVTATADTGKVTWPSAFRKDTLKYNLNGSGECQQGNLCFESTGRLYHNRKWTGVCRKLCGGCKQRLHRYKGNRKRPGKEPGIYLPHFPGYFYAGFGEHDA